MWHIGRRGRPVARIIPLLLAALAGLAFLTVRYSRPVARPAAAPANRQRDGSAAPPTRSYKTAIAFVDARPILAAHAHRLPKDLSGQIAGGLEAAWPAWVSRQDAAIRARLARGDEDSIVNLWLYGTTFTTRPRATARDIARLRGRDEHEELLLGRLDDLVDGMSSPGANERLQFARQVLERQGIDPASPPGKQQARVYLVAARERAIAEHARYQRLLASAGAVGDSARLDAYVDAYRDRGLSSDTSIQADFAVHQALHAIRASGGLAPGSIRRVAIVGPGLDFTDKVDGHDFYPQQTIQPFAVVDSLIRTGLAAPDRLRVTTLDLSPRVNRHIEAARERARRGDAYVLQLPLDRDVPGREWRPEMVEYWNSFGGTVGDAVEAAAPPPGARDVRVRAVRVSPEIVLSLVPYDLNIVLERLDPLDPQERFDLIVATNVLVYYDAFQQALALANIVHMLRPGGLFLTNYAVVPAASMDPAPLAVTKVFWDRQHNGDTVFTFRKR